MVEVNRVKVKETFVPISIVLETKEEAEAMALYLACPDNTSFIEYCQRKRISVPEELIQSFCAAVASVLEDGELVAKSYP